MKIGNKTKQNQTHAFKKNNFLVLFSLPLYLSSTLLDACNWQPVVFLGQRFLDRLLFFLREPSGTDRLLSSSFQSSSQSSSICAHLLCPTGPLCRDWDKLTEPERPPHRLGAQLRVKNQIQSMENIWCGGGGGVVIAAFSETLRVYLCVLLDPISATFLPRSIFPALPDWW